MVRLGGRASWRGLIMFLFRLRGAIGPSLRWGDGGCFLNLVILNLFQDTALLWETDRRDRPQPALGRRGDVMDSRAPSRLLWLAFSI